MTSLNHPAPEFCASATGGKQLCLADFRGQRLLLYFYPKDNTPGCTQQGLAFRDHYAQFTALGTVILGVSRDSVKTHENFKAKHGFPFDLLSDPDETLCQAYAVIKMKNMYGKQVLGIERSSFLIDASGILLYEWRKVKVAGHAADVLQTLSALPQT